MVACAHGRAFHGVAALMVWLASTTVIGARQFDVSQHQRSARGGGTSARPTLPCEPLRSVTQRCEGEARGALINRKRARKSLFCYRGGADEKVEGHCIGIDLGTTYSCVGVWKNGRVEIIANDQGNRITPSYVAWTADDQRLIGDAAKKQASANPENMVYDAKRLIGPKFADQTVQEDMKHWPFEVVDVEGKPKVVVTAGGRKQFSPEEISSMVLAKMKAIAEDYLGTAVKYAGRDGASVRTSFSGSTRSGWRASSRRPAAPTRRRRTRWTGARRRSRASSSGSSPRRRRRRRPRGASSSSPAGCTILRHELARGFHSWIEWLDERRRLSAAANRPRSPEKSRGMRSWSAAADEHRQLRSVLTQVAQARDAPPRAPVAAPVGRGAARKGAAAALGGV